MKKNNKKILVKFYNKFAKEILWNMKISNKVYTFISLNYTLLI